MPYIKDYMMTYYEKMLKDCMHMQAMHKANIAAQIAQQQEFERRINAACEEAIAIVNKPLNDLIRDIRQNR